MRYFNTTGLCVPDQDYMVDISGKIRRIREMVGRGYYFTINRARQYGKTTTLSRLEKNLFDEYVCARISFEGLGDEPFRSPPAFCAIFTRLIQRALRFSSAAEEGAYIESWVDPEVRDFDLLSQHIDRMCRDRKFVLMIDEVDKTSGNRTYIHFLGMLRDMYLSRKDGRICTFQSVILAGVYDIKNLKLKMMNEGVYSPAADEGKLYNSPWNIAADFTVDMSFNPEEIATMLGEYEGDHHTGMDIPAISGEIYAYTAGYPFLVSRICQLLDERFERDWSLEGVRRTVKYLVGQEQNTLFDDIFKNLEAYKDLYELIYDVLILGIEKKYSADDPVVNRALMFGFVRQGEGKILPANRIFEIRITNYFISKDARRPGRREVNGVFKYDVVKEGRFDMELCLRRFARHFSQGFSKRDIPFLERHGRLVFLSFLTPLINGEGFYYIESETTDAQRMDLVVSYNREEFIIELKIWRGGEAHRAGVEQLAGYLRRRGAREGYLL
ncbi:MAG: AAA-like domain-containing protein, partial [Spirochaetaceae bacterium]|nr:AAA-like domain-containing protein [Spirochaetaceae bacterium]